MHHCVISVSKVHGAVRNVPCSVVHGYGNAAERPSHQIVPEGARPPLLLTDPITRPNTTTLSPLVHVKPTHQPRHRLRAVAAAHAAGRAVAAPAAASPGPVPGPRPSIAAAARRCAAKTLQLQLQGQHRVGIRARDPAKLSTTGGSAPGWDGGGGFQAGWRPSAVGFHVAYAGSRVC